MTWTCEQTESRLSDYLDGLLQPAEQTAFDLHVNGCARCTPLVAGVSHVLGTLHKLESVEPSPQLVNSILTATQGPQTWRNAKRWLRGLQSPRFVYSAVSVAATFVVLLTSLGFSWRKPKLADLAPATIYRNADRQVHLVYARSSKFVSDLRVVYEIQSRMNENEQNPAVREQTIPQSSPSKKDPGQTDNTNPASPKQQNRANEIGRNLEVLACQFPILSGSLVERRYP
ncbi:MAG TPA: zf-HC2 domain-containing protein [Candidatus Acidoferrum sp.]|jgi:anti-sigma factor RsiW|nr:zf-HC2 domain-containing protein [Candidatus Acidoferrum sp.]